MPATGQRDQGPEQRHATDKGFRSVDRVQNPDEFGAFAHPAELLADDPVIRKAFLDQPAHRQLRGAVGGGHRGQV